MKLNTLSKIYLVSSWINGATAVFNLIALAMQNGEGPFSLVRVVLLVISLLMLAFNFGMYKYLRNK